MSTRAERRKAWLAKQERLAATKTVPMAVNQNTAPPAPSEPEQQGLAKWIRIGVGAAGTAVWIGLASWSYTAATVGDMIGAGVLLALAFFVGVGALMASERFGAFENRSRLRLNLSFAAGLGAFSCVLFWWEYHNKPAITATADDIADKIIERIRLSPAIGHLRSRHFSGLSREEQKLRM